MKKKIEELKQPKRNERQVKKEKAKKEFKIEIVKIGKLEENTAGSQPIYICEPSDD